MAPPYKTRIDGIVVPARSRDNIASNAALLRQILNLTNKPYFPVVDVYEFLDLLFDGASFEVREVREMGEDHGRTFPDKKVIYIREDIYERAYQGQARDRFTMCHELGHLMMHRGVALSRIDPLKPPKIYCNSEWQADTFASHLLLPRNLLINYNSVLDVMTAFGVSFEAAQARLADMKNA
jgi:hypothetical protein